jgi:hypothetical protein
MVGASRGFEASEGEAAGEEIDGGKADGDEVEDDMMDTWSEISFAEMARGSENLQVLMQKTASAESNSGGAVVSEHR